MPSTLRTHLKETRKDILKIKKPVDPQTDVGALISQCERPIMFENITGFPGWRICDLLVKDRRRQAIALKTDEKNVVRTLADMINKGPGKTRTVKSGPVKEKMLKGEQARFDAIPFCVHHPRDGGPYLGSGMCVVRDPDTGFQNVAMHRIHIKAPDHAAVHMFSPHSKGILAKYVARKQPAPLAIVIGHHPCFEIASNYFGPHEGWSEHELAGSLLGETVDMVRCENSDILVPAQAEIILECEIDPEVTVPEGPFGEFHLYYASAVAPKPRVTIKTITMREDALFRQINSAPYTDHQPLAILPGEARLYDQLRRKGCKIHDVFVPPWGGLFMTILQITGMVEEEVREAMLTALFSPTLLFTKTVIAVDDDIDIYDSNDIIYALATRVDPRKDIIQIEGTIGLPYDLALAPIPEVPPLRKGAKLAINATKPPLSQKDWRDRFERINPKGWGEISLKDFI